MAEEIIKTIENVDKLFSQIVVNGEVHNSERYAPPARTQSSAPRSSSRQTVQGEDVYGVNLNDTLHNFTDRTVAEALAEEASARQLADEVIRSNIESINDKIPSGATSSNKLVDNASMTSAINVVQAGLSDLEALVPSQASASNQLADKNFVNSSIATNTANFLGTYTSLSDIQAIQNPTNNDYAFLQTTDSAGNRQYDRYKYSSSDNQWHYEYTLNNSSFTAEQWATINSGLTQASVQQAIATACAYCASSNTTVTGASLYTGATLKVLFTAQIAGADTSSALIITYNSTPYAVKTAKDGSLIDFTAKASGNDFVYCQAYTTLELMFDGTNFIIIGNPVVISNSDYTIYADGSNTQSIQALVKNTSASIGRALRFFGTFDGSEQFANNIGRVNLGYGGWCYIATPRMDRQFPVNNDSSDNLYIAFNSIFDIFCDYETANVYVRCNYDYGSGWHALW